MPIAKHPSGMNTEPASRGVFKTISQTNNHNVFSVSKYIPDTHIAGLESMDEDAFPILKIGEIPLLCKHYITLPKMMAQENMYLKHVSPKSNMGVIFGHFRYEFLNFRGIPRASPRGPPTIHFTGCFTTRPWVWSFPPSCSGTCRWCKNDR